MGVERRAGHRRHPDVLDEPHRERRVVLDPVSLQEVGDVGEDVVGAPRLPRDEPRRLNVTIQKVPPGLVLRAQARVVRVGQPERGHRGFLQRVGRADGDEVVGPPDAGAEIGGSDRVPDPPARHRVRLRDPRDRHGALRHSRQRRDRRVAEAVVDDVLVDLVGDREQVVLDAERGDRLELGAREDLPRRVVRAVEDDRARPRGHGPGETVGVEGEGGRLEGDEDGLGAGDDAAGPVVLVERLEDDHLIPGVQDRQERREHRLGRAAADGHVPLGIDLHAVALRVFVGDGAAEPRRAPRDRVLMEVAVDRSVCRRDQLRGRREVRHALREVDAAHLAHDPRHLADDGLREPLDPLRDPGRAHALDAVCPKRWDAARPRGREGPLETRASGLCVGGALKLVSDG